MVRRAAFSRHEDEVGAQIEREGARLAVEVADVEIVQVQIAEHAIDRGQSGEPGEGTSAARRHLDHVRVKDAGEGPQNGDEAREEGHDDVACGEVADEGASAAARERQDIHLMNVVETCIRCVEPGQDFARWPFRCWR